LNQLNLKGQGKFIIMDINLVATNKEIIDKLAEIPSRQVLASGGEAVMDGNMGENSPFTQVLLNGLCTMPKNKFTATELSSYILNNFSPNINQLPIFGALISKNHKGGEFVFVKKEEEIDKDWKEVLNINTEEVYINFLQKHPASKFQSKAIELLTQIEEENSWQKVIKENNIKNYLSYLEAYPSGKYNKEAQSLLDTIRGEKEKQKILEELDNKREIFCFSLCKSKNNYETYLELYPSGQFTVECNKHIKDLSNLIDKDTVKSLRLLIAKARTEEAIDILTSKESEYSNDFILLSTRWYQIKANEMSGRIKPVDNEDKNNVINSVLEFLKQIEKDYK
jgi:Effector-associated domain 11